MSAGPVDDIMVMACCSAQYLGINAKRVPPIRADCLQICLSGATPSRRARAPS